MDTLGYYRIRIGVAPTEDRARSLRARRRRIRAEARWQPPAPVREGRRRFSIAGLIGLFVTRRDPRLGARKADGGLG
jgi:hypothetical protein